MLLSIAATADNERGPHYMAQALAAIHAACGRRDVLWLEYGIHEKTVRLFCRVSGPLARMVERQLAAWGVVTTGALGTIHFLGY